MSYAGEYDPTPVPEPKKKPKISVDLYCGETVMTDNVWWSSDPLYGGWKIQSTAWCDKHKKMETIKQKTWPPKVVYS